MRSRRPQLSQDLFRTTASRRGMRPLRGNYAGLSFGTPSLVGRGECPVPEVGLMPYPGDIRFGGKSKTWCACVFGEGTELYNQCVGPDFWFYPWTVPGKAERGWNWEIGDLLIGGSTGGGTTGSTTTTGGGYTPPPQQQGGGGGVGIAAGLLALAFLLK